VAECPARGGGEEGVFTAVQLFLSEKEKYSYFIIFLKRFDKGNVVIFELTTIGLKVLIFSL
jgi:hypothetical protein